MKSDLPKNTQNNEEKILKEIMKGLDTQGYKKLWSYFFEVMRTEKFQKKIKSLRIDFDIPEKCFELQNNFPPKNWKYRLDNPAWNKRIETICAEYDLHFSYWSNVIENYAFYNDLSLIFNSSYDLCFFIDVNNDLKKLDLDEKRMAIKIKKSDDHHFPFAIRISPYASERDIIDFIKKNFTTLIEPNQKRYFENNSIKKVPIGKTKKKKFSIQERNDFLYKNQNLPKKDLMKIISEKYPPAIDYAYITNIISKENKKRKDV